jgi:hypothetical protein
MCECVLRYSGYCEFYHSVSVVVQVVCEGHHRLFVRLEVQCVL